MSPDFQPWRRNVDFLDCAETPIRPLIDALDFIEDKSRWGYKFRFGVFKIDDHDLEVIRSAMTGAAANGGYCEPVSNTDAAPAEVACVASPFAGVLHPREVPLGGPRAIRVRRTLPQRERSLIGAWCFADHYGPHDVRGGQGMDVPPHPHTGLQTVSWLFSGEVEHRDSAGVHAMVRPGELNLMTAGAGICHSEVSTAATTVLHGVQLWVALPDSDRDTGRDFAHYVPQPRSVAGATLRVFLGELAGDRSPVHTFTPLLGAQIDLDPGARPHPRRRSSLRARRAARSGQRRGRGYHACGGRSGVPGSRGRLSGGRQPRSKPGAGPAARRSAVPRTAGDVVELRRAQPRGHRGLPADVAGPRRPLRCGSRIPGSGRHACLPHPSRTRRCVRGPIPGYRRSMATDKTGAPTTVTQESDRFSIAVDGKNVGFTEYVDRDGQRVFPTPRSTTRSRAEVWNDSHRRGAAGHPRGRATDCPGLPDGGRIRQEARRVHRRRGSGGRRRQTLAGELLAELARYRRSR